MAPAFISARSAVAVAFFIDLHPVTWARPLISRRLTRGRHGAEVGERAIWNGAITRARPGPGSSPGSSGVHWRVRPRGTMAPRGRRHGTRSGPRSRARAAQPRPYRTVGAGQRSP